MLWGAPWLWGDEGGLQCLSTRCRGLHRVQLVAPHLPHRETVVDVLGAGLGHTGIRQVHLVKDQGLRGRNQSPSPPGRDLCPLLGWQARVPPD